MSIKKIKLMVYILTIFAFVQCTDSVNNNMDAEKVDVGEISFRPGFDWFSGYYISYAPDSLTINAIKAAYDPNVYKFYCFIIPACKCDDNQQNLPNALKTINSAAIGSDKIEVYIMNTLTTKHPYSDTLSIKTLPAIFVVKNGEPVYSVIDSMLSRNYKVGKPGSISSIEALILEALQK
jgi:hypothetical protein